MENRASTLKVFYCNAVLEVVHAHLVRAAHCHDPGDWVLVYPQWVSGRMVRPECWTKLFAVLDTRPEYGNISGRMRANLSRLAAEIPLAPYERIELVVSDLFWLMNNVLAASLVRYCSAHDIEFRLTLMDEGTALYTTTHLGLRPTLRSLAKYCYLILRGFPALFVHSGHAHYRHRLCREVLCLHPELLSVPPEVLVERIRPELLNGVYGDLLPILELPPHSCLYLSQPLYKLVGMERQSRVVRAFTRNLQRQGIIHFFYKPHHADVAAWCDKLEQECGLRLLPFREKVAIEFIAPGCFAEVVAGHTTSALMNLKVYGYQGRVIAFGMDELKQSFAEKAQYDAFCRCIRQLGSVEWINSKEL